MKSILAFTTGLLVFIAVSYPGFWLSVVVFGFWTLDEIIKDNKI